MYQSSTIEKEVLNSNLWHAGWLITDYIPVRMDHEVNFHSCGTKHSEGDVFFKPVFEKGNSPQAIEHTPSEEWVECQVCVESHTA